MTPVTLSQQPRLANTQDLQTFIFSAFQRAEDIPAWGKRGRIAKLREFARTEPILSGALSSMTSKAMSLDWQVVGGRNRVRQFQELLAEAEDGAGWQSFLERFVQDYLNTDIGGIAELARHTPNGPVAGLYHVDAECVALTGNVNYPLQYAPKLPSGKLANSVVKFRPEDYARIVDMASPDEVQHQLGFCAVSRAVKAARVLLALYNYDEEKLADLPMPGVVAITGLTMDEVAAAFKLYDAARQSKEQQIFKNLLWFAAQASALQPIKVEFVPFAGLPENFDREQTISLYIYTLALVFGVDAREFWPATQSGATKGEAEVQAQKAKGKGFGQMLTAIERAINWYVLPRDVEFAFDRRNDDDDLAREILRGQVIKNVRQLWEPAGGGGFGSFGSFGAKPADPNAAPTPVEPAEKPEGIISTEEARRLLVELDAMPDWLAPTPDETLYSMDRAEDQAGAAKAARLTDGAELCAVDSRGDLHVLYTPTTVHTMPVELLPWRKAQKDAAIAHLQAAGLLINGEHDA